MKFNRMERSTINILLWQKLSLPARPLAFVILFHEMKNLFPELTVNIIENSRNGKILESHDGGVQILP
jgi:hypothetical protein